MPGPYARPDMPGPTGVRLLTPVTSIFENLQAI
jgi:hypothetical protein